MDIVVYLISMIILAYLSVGIGRSLEQKRFCETMAQFFRFYEKGLKEQHEEFQRGVLFINDFLIDNFLRDKDDAM